MGERVGVGVCLLCGCVSVHGVSVCARCVVCVRRRCVCECEQV